ncbi:MAG: carotenoid 1,2-hydratase [Nitrospirae bacterium]|nr:carotenoid 1,2-hydratase [Candidatus Manganitrophaceae bacterium]
MNKPIRILLLLLILWPPLPGAAERFERAQPGYRFSFPRDHGTHPNFKIEWWYFTGNLSSAGNEIGYELTFFRRGIDPPKGEENPSRWAVKDLYFAHFALTDGVGKRFFYTDKISREAIGKAGAQRDRLEVWIDRWRAVQETDGTIHLQAEAEGETDRPGWKIDLLLTPEKPPVIQGSDGISRKGGEPGQASHYISYTRLQTEGTVSIGGKGQAVAGLTWMDHEFSSSMLNKNQVGWDWFSIQLKEGGELMLYQIRTIDGKRDPFSSGTVVHPDGTSRHLTADAFTLTPARYWKSPANSTSYPVGWKIEVPSEGLSLTSDPILDAQELITSKSTRVAYWEGASRFSGTRQGRPVTGKGYVELTGYDQPFGQ